MTYIQFAEEPSQEERIAKLRAELKKLGGSTTSLESMPADMEEEFLRHVLEYETAEPISLMRLLENSGLEVPAPELLDKDALRVKLREIIERMASLGAYLLHTNHLSDRELYVYLYHDGLREEAVLFPENPSYSYMIDLTGSGRMVGRRVKLSAFSRLSTTCRISSTKPSSPTKAFKANVLVALAWSWLAHAARNSGVFIG
jgi:hypothetical protein